jgi:putative membrane protein
VHTDAEIFAIDRPHPSLLKQYWLQALLAGPFSLFVGLALYFRYHSMRYRFDEHGITKSYGILLRREVHLAYGRIQDIHLSSGPLQRWLGLADLLVQTASGSAGAELVIEGLLEFEAVRDFLYARMRGAPERHDAKAAVEPASGASIDVLAPTAPSAPSALAEAARDGEAIALLHEIRDELRAGRVALEARAGRTAAAAPESGASDA